MSDSTTSGRSANIAAAIRMVLDEANTRAAETTKLRGEVKELDKSAKAVREETMDALNALAIENDYGADEITLACNMLADTKTKDTNAPALDRSVATFLGEAKLAMYPKVRDAYSALVSIRDAAWDAEEAAYKAGRDSTPKVTLPTPLKAVFSRRYQMLVAMLRVAKNGDDTKMKADENNVVDEDAGKPYVFKDTADLHRYAKRKLDAKAITDLDIEAVMKKLEAMRAELLTITNAFPCDDMTALIEALSRDNLHQGMVEGRKSMLARTQPAKRGVAAKAPTTPVVTDNTPVVTATSDASVNVLDAVLSQAADNHAVI
jgi:hypothetical protein